MLESPSTVQKFFGSVEGVILDLESLVVCGHSFGGITAMSYAIESDLHKKAKAVIGLDAWWLPVNKRITDPAISKSNPCLISDKSPKVLMVNTSKFS
jgi:pimeloyl-ACP methyl ester carboxylesterase